jgi:hypothetical protein
MRAHVGFAGRSSQDADDTGGGSISMVFARGLYHEVAAHLTECYGKPDLVVGLNAGTPTFVSRIENYVSLCHVTHL